MPLEPASGVDVWHWAYRRYDKHRGTNDYVVADDSPSRVEHSLDRHPALARVEDICAQLRGRNSCSFHRGYLPDGHSQARVRRGFFRAAPSGRFIDARLPDAARRVQSLEEAFRALEDASRTN